ncbi:MAG: hypothetical protein HS104_34600 [Polyangiaceae bacterium]|nr:hypothetical protein [Polyangiaceae bacterium]
MLSTRALPDIYATRDELERKKTLRSYVSSYSREEVQAEALTRNVEGFARFLRVAAVDSGHFLDPNRRPPFRARRSSVSSSQALSW